MQLFVKEFFTLMAIGKEFRYFQTTPYNNSFFSLAFIFIFWPFLTALSFLIEFHMSTKVLDFRGYISEHLLDLSSLQLISSNYNQFHFVLAYHLLDPIFIIRMLFLLFSVLKFSSFESLVFFFMILIWCIHSKLARRHTMLKIFVVNKLTILVNNSNSNYLVLVIYLLEDDTHYSTHWLIRNDRVDIIFILPCSSTLG